MVGGRGGGRGYEEDTDGQAPHSRPPISILEQTCAGQKKNPPRLDLLTVCFERQRKVDKTFNQGLHNWMLRLSNKLAGVDNAAS